MPYNWILCSDRLPTPGMPVMTKIDDAKGVRNEQSLTLFQRSPETRPMWFYPDMSMYVYYEPTHWASFDTQGEHNVPSND